MTTSSGKTSIVFFGTPDFAAGCLKVIIENKYEVVAVITAPDKPAGRGRVLKSSPVKDYALSLNIRVMQPVSLKDPDFLNDLKGLNADLFVVVAFRMLPPEVWKMAPLGTFNLHASLLPDYRGAAPINRAIMNGETKTGVTTFFINEEIDKGSVLFMEETSISDTDTAGTLHDRLMHLGSGLIIKTIESIYKGEAKPKEQEIMVHSGPLKTASKIFRDDCRINWIRPVRNVYNLIRGLDPYPGAWTMMTRTGTNEQHILKVFACSPLARNHSNTPGTLIREGNLLLAATSDGYLNIQSVQLEGKKKMNSDDFLRGFKDISSYSLL